MDSVSTTNNEEVEYDYQEHNKMTCWFCSSEMLWGCVFDYEDYGLEGDGIVATLSCSECEAYAEFYSKPEKG